MCFGPLTEWFTECVFVAGSQPYVMASSIAKPGPGNGYPMKAQLQIMGLFMISVIFIIRSLFVSYFGFLQNGN